MAVDDAEEAEDTAALHDEQDLDSLAVSIPSSPSGNATVDVSPSVVPDSLLRSRYGGILERALRRERPALTAETAEMLRERPELTLQLLNSTVTAVGTDTARVQALRRLYRSLEVSSSPSLDEAWEKLDRSRAISNRVIYYDFIQQSDDAPRHLLHYAMHRRDLDIGERLHAAHFLDQLGEKAGRMFVRRAHRGELPGLTSEEASYAKTYIVQALGYDEEELK